jgi:hypothetical protein
VQGSSGGAVSVRGSAESPERDQAVHPDAGISPSRLAVTSTPRPATRARGSAVSALPRIHGHRPAAGDPDDRPVPARQVIHAGPGSPARAPMPGPAPRSRSYRTTLTALTRHFTLSAPRPQGTGPPPHTDPCATRNLAVGQDPHKIPTPHAPHRPHQHRANTTIFTHFCWPEARLESSRDRTRTYNLPVNRRSFTAGSARGCQRRHPVLPA